MKCVFELISGIPKPCNEPNRFRVEISLHSLYNYPILKQSLSKQTLYTMKKVLWSFFEILETVVIAVAAVFVVRTFVAQPFLVSGASMEPTFYNGDYLLVDEIAYRFREPERGEVVVFKYPGDHKSFYIKRIIGLPGERVVIENDMVTVYSKDKGEKVLHEPYLGGNKTNGTVEVTLDGGKYFVMGDNRGFSFDSRSWGPVSTNELIGLVRFRLWPVNEAMAFSAPSY
jgi:signal peptidase I